MLAPYRQMAGVPRLPALLAWSLLGRLHMTGTPIAITFLVAGWTGSYALAGVVSAMLTAGTAIAGPMRGRAADRRSARRLLTTTAIGYGLGLSALAVLPAAVWPLAPVLAFGAGLCLPPVIPLGRATWPRLATGAAREATYTAESTLQELLFVVGPILASAAVAFADARVALLGCGAAAVVGAIGFGQALHRAGCDRPAPLPPGTPRPNPFTLFTVPRLARLIVVVLLIVAALNAVDLVMVAWSRNRGTPALAGVLAALWAIGSLFGGLVSGTVRGPPNLPRRLVAVAISAAVLIPTLPPLRVPASPWLVGAVLLVGGAAIAPAIAAGMSRVGRVAPADRRGEAFGWVSTATTAGAALSAPLTGWLVDGSGAAAGVAGGAVIAAAAALLALGTATRARPLTGHPGDDDGEDH